MLCSKDGYHYLHVEKEGKPVPEFSTVINLSDEDYEDFQEFWKRENYSETWENGLIKIEWRKRWSNQ